VSPPALGMVRREHAGGRAVGVRAGGAGAAGPRGGSARAPPLPVTIGLPRSDLERRGTPRAPRHAAAPGHPP